MLSIMPNITDGWAGRINPRTQSLSRFSPGFAAVINDYQYQVPIDMGYYDCDNCTLSATVRSSKSSVGIHEVSSG